MSTHIIYHQVKGGIDCPDGIISASIAYGYHSSIGLIVTVSVASYRKEYPELPDIYLPEDTNKLIIVDFSYPLSWLLHWELECNITVTVIEHHADKFPWLENFSGSVLDKKECGATITWKYYYGDLYSDIKMPEILSHVRNRDIGLNGYYSGDIPESEAINLGLGKYRSSLKNLPILDKLDAIFNRIFSPFPRDLEHFKDIGEPEIIERDRLIESRLPMSSVTEIDNIPCAFYDMTSDEDIKPHGSMLGHRLAKYNNVQLAMIKDENSMSLRSLSEDTDCSMIAKKRGGGGHPCASGFKIS